MAYALTIGLRYLRSKKRSTVSLITVIAIIGVALGVGALLAVLSITSGFQDAFRDKVLGVNAHVLVLKYGLDFEEYRDVIAMAREMPEVSGAAPFVINEMMVAKGDRISGVLVKGVDPELMPTVLDLPGQMIDGSLDGLRRPGAMPPVQPDQVGAAGAGEDLDAYLRGLTEGGSAASGAAPSEGDVPDAGSAGASAGGDVELGEEQMERLREQIAASGGREPIVVEDEGEAAEWEPAWAREAEGELADGEVEPLPEVDVPTPEEMEAALRELEASEGLPDDTAERQIFEEEALLVDDMERVADADLPGIVVGTTLAQSVGLGVGDRVQVISPLAGLDTSLWAPDARTPKTREFRVIGIFEAGFQEYDSRLVYVDLYEAQAFFDQGDTVTGVEMRLHDIDAAKDVAERIERELGGGPFHTMDWEELNRNLFTALEIQKVMLSLVTASIMVVAALVVIATLIILVLEKKREIAILKAMGAKDASVLGIFMVQGTVIGFVGTLVGLLLGGGAMAYLALYEFPLDPKVYLIDHLPVRVSPWEFVVTVAVGLAIVALAVLVPSWWAARLLPADGVRYE
jgi:lipoprotein-releasing system permease protein